MTLKPQDLLVLLKIIAKAGACWTYGSLAAELGMSPAEVHSAVKQAYRAGLLALIDMLRMGRAREKALASKRFSQRLAEFRDKSGRKNEVEHEH